MPPPPAGSIVVGLPRCGLDRDPTRAAAFPAGFAAEVELAGNDVAGVDVAALGAGAFQGDCRALPTTQTLRCNGVEPIDG